MASLYTRGDSQFFWISYRDAIGQLRQESTRLSWKKPHEARKARALEAQRTADELSRGANAAVGRTKAKGWAWVEPWLKVRYGTKPTTLERFLGCWRALHPFLVEKEIESPQSLLRDHCFQYVIWRKQTAGHNTALLELKVLRISMTEAVIRGFASGNPCVALGIGKEDAQEKPELTPEHERIIREGFVRVQNLETRNMLQVSFEIARHQGCRLSETRIDLFKDIDLDGLVIRFPRTKGKKPRAVPMHPGLVPLIQRLRNEGRKMTWEIPIGKGRQWASSKWWKFLDDRGLKTEGVTHHSNRVTVVTEMVRAGVPEALAMEFVGHGSVTVHRGYKRLKPADLGACVAAIAKGPKPERS